MGPHHCPVRLVLPWAVVPLGLGVPLGVHHPEGWLLALCWLTEVTDGLQELEIVDGPRSVFVEEVEDRLDLDLGDLGLGAHQDVQGLCEATQIDTAGLLGVKMTLKNTDCVVANRERNRQVLEEHLEQLLVFVARQVGTGLCPPQELQELDCRHVGIHSLLPGPLDADGLEQLPQFCRADHMRHPKRLDRLNKFLASQETIIVPVSILQRFPEGQGSTTSLHWVVDAIRQPVDDVLDLAASGA
mmetsp:Transcript_30519/g.54881  ORF Transcript_30519/g.54881 Transcript_30519/m.54881 type:complete len:243 (+) Transcript_30519:580-1308(+)